MKKRVLILFGTICFVSVILFLFFNLNGKRKDINELVAKYSTEYGLEEELVLAVIKAESDFKKDAVSRSGALGLMQLIPDTAKWIASELGEEYSKEKMFNEETNIKYGCFYLKYLFSKFKDKDVVICAYNAGEGVVRNWINEDGSLDRSKISFDETKKYLERVNVFFDSYKSNIL